MTEREAAVAWLEKDYDGMLRLKTEIFDDEVWGPYSLYFMAMETRSRRGLMFTVKDQNG